ncbi:hypothetical protein [Mesorhizobium sp. CO1-1-8]|uniref:hypothetical protein n=1 Tax=Mesorhizobium sp. CO1-1-8 TaxID=2876631 RepID=UPI001CD12FEC|nr:hypothetical protein [Mesorhizobium sp. CO1-1-8]MBZ9775993.1 hypothetical protein [Mesorhizobium sp. CO1-1-8]
MTDTDARLGLREFDTHMTVVIHPPLDQPRRLDPGVGRDEVKNHAVMPWLNAELEQTADLQVTRRLGREPVVGCVPPHDVGRIVESPPDGLDRRVQVGTKDQFSNAMCWLGV